MIFLNKYIKQKLEFLDNTDSQFQEHKLQSVKGSQICA